MSYKTFLGATQVVQSYDGSGVSYGSATNVSPVDEDPKESPAKPKDEVSEGPTGGEDYSEQNKGGGGDEGAKPPTDTSFNPTIILGILAVAYFLFKKKK
jgi:hypothetical protein